MLKKLLKTIVGTTTEERQAKLYRDFIHHEAKIGGTLFGPVPAGGRREFFCLDDRTWVWHEEWLDSRGERQHKTTRYDIRPDGILKAQDGTNYQQLTDQESEHLYHAVLQYKERVNKELYSFV